MYICMQYLYVYTGCPATTEFP